MRAVVSAPTIPINKYTQIECQLVTTLIADDCDYASAAVASSPHLRLLFATHLSRIIFPKKISTVQIWLASGTVLASDFTGEP